MPIQSLPLELIGEIVFHLEVSPETCAESIRDGKAVALVCRAWKHLGQALRWTTVRIRAHFVPSLEHHLNRFPHLAKFVQILSIEENGDFLDFFTPEDTRDRVPQVLSKLTRVQYVAIEGDFCEGLSSIFKATNGLPRLQTLDIHLSAEVVWNEQVVSNLVEGFPKLSVFAFSAMNLVFAPKQFDKSGRTERRIPLKILSVGWSNQDGEEAQVVDNFFSIFEQTTLRKILLMNLSAPLIRWLSVCPALVTLVLPLSPAVIRQNFAEFLSILPLFPSLIQLQLNVILPDDSMGYTPPVPLALVLAAFPPSLKVFAAPRLIFLDHESIPPRTLPVSMLSSLNLLFALCLEDPDGGEALKMGIWRDGAGDDSRWYRHVGEEREEGQDEVETGVATDSEED